VRTLYRASRVYTLSHPATGEWVLVDGRHVERVGSGEPPAADRIVELPGTTIIPGFVDAHVHMTTTGVRIARPDAATVAGADDLMEMIASMEPGVAGIAFLHGFDESTWEEQRLPKIDELDAIPHPVIAVRADVHLCLANGPAMLQSGAADLPGAQRDGDGALTGIASMQAAARLLQWFTDSLSANEIEEFQLQAAALAARNGVTTVHEMSVPEYHGIRDLETLLGHTARLPVDVVAYVASTDVGWLLDRGLSRIGGDLSLDGSIGARTAHLSSDYVDAPGRGVGYLDDETLFETLHDAHVAGMQVGLHVIGDAAIEQAIEVWERVYRTLDSRARRHFRARRHRLEHLEMPTSDQIERAAILGLAASVQPAFDSAWGGPGRLYEQRLGEARAAAMNPFRSFVERGIEVGAGSDAPITPLDPMRAVMALEHHHDAAQRFTREEAIRLCTLGGAKLARQEDKKGHLAPGCHADLAAYDADPMTADLEGLRPILTVSLGREVHAH
jgi:predicted amidohydrolase YtcJ